MGVAILAFFGVFLLIASAGLLLFYREAMLQRVLSVIGAARPEKASLSGKLQNAGTSIGVVVESLEKVIPKSLSEISVVQQRLIRAGLRNDSAVKFFYGSKVVVIVALCAVG